jgi:hypothetical protein
MEARYFVACGVGRRPKDILYLGCHDILRSLAVERLSATGRNFYDIVGGEKQYYSVYSDGEAAAVSINSVIVTFPAVRLSPILAFCIETISPKDVDASISSRC